MRGLKDFKGSDARCPSIHFLFHATGPRKTTNCMAAGGKGRLVAEPNFAERQVSLENQLQVQMA